MPNSESAAPVAGRGEKVFNLEERTAVFGEAVIRFCKTIPHSVITEPLIKQIVRSSTSVGANYCEADDAVSGKEFRQKIGTWKKRSRERPSTGCGCWQRPNRSTRRRPGSCGGRPMSCT